MIGKQMRVLLLEDEPAHTEAIRRALESPGNSFLVQVVGSLKEFHDYVKTNPPDIALLDMVLPDGNGIDLLKSLPKPNAFPLLILTSHGNEKIAVEALKAGALDYIVKSPDTFAETPRILLRNLNQWALIQENKQIQQSLQTSEANFHNSMENSPLGIRIVSEDGETLYTNHAFLDIYGYKSLEEFNSTPVKNRYTPESYIEFSARREKRRNGEPFPENYEVSIRRKNGQISHLQVIRKRIIWGGKQHYQAIYQDITERKRAEEKLKESEERMHIAGEVARIGTYFYDFLSGDSFWSREFKALLGLRVDEPLVLDKNLLPICIHPDDYQPFLSAMTSANSPDGNGIFELDYRIILPNRSTRWLHARGRTEFKQMGAHRIKQHAIGAVVDITERKQTEAALLASEERFRLIAESALVGVYILQDGKYSYANPAMARIFGYSVDEFIGMVPHQVVQPTNHTMVDENIRRRIDGEVKALQYEVKGRYKDGSTRDVEVHGSSVEINGKLALIGTLVDITERKRVEVEKKQIEEKAQIASRLVAIGEMAAGIAHEINNPLTAVIGFSKLVLENSDLSEELKEDLSIVVESSQRISDIIKGLLTFARQSKPVKTSVNLNEIIENTLKLREYVLKTNNIQLITELDPNLSWTVVDPGQMQQVFLNLIVNAEQAMKKAHGRGTLKIVSQNMGDYIKLIVQDDGPGISRQNLERMFEPFFTTKDPGEGTGLGLSLSRSIVLEHNGTMKVESKEGFGATFTIELPFGDSEFAAAATAELSVAEPNAVKKLRILVVDDEPGVRKLLEKAFTSKGHSVDVISDAASAMEIIDAGTIYDIIITDVRMPGINGMDLYKLIIRRMPEMKNRVIVITGDVMGEDIKSFLTDYQIPYLTKPFKVKEIEEKIDNILTNKK